MKLAVDLVVSRWAGTGYEFLFITRRHPPFQGRVALPGGFVEEDESTVAAAVRELAEETGVAVTQAEMKLIGVYSDPERDPRGRVVSVAYAVEVPFGTKAVAGDDAATAFWMKHHEAARYGLAFDHAQIMKDDTFRRGKDALLAMRPLPTNKQGVTNEVSE